MNTQKISLEEPEKAHERQTRNIIGELDPSKEQCYNCDKWCDKDDLVIVYEDGVDGDLPTIKVCKNGCRQKDESIKNESIKQAERIYFPSA